MTETACNLVQPGAMLGGMRCGICNMGPCRAGQAPVKPPFQEPAPVNWSKILDDLQNAGLCNAEVARRLDFDDRKLRKWKAGDAKPDSHSALKLLAFHSWVMN